MSRFLEVYMISSIPCATYTWYGHVWFVTCGLNPKYIKDKMSLHRNYIYGNLSPFVIVTELKINI